MPKALPSQHIISNVDQLKQIRSEWEELHESSCLQSPFLTIEYLQLWYSCFAQPEQVRIYRAVDGGETIGFLPMILRKQGPARVLTSLTNDHCLHSEALVTERRQKQFPEAILRSLSSDKSWDVLRYAFSNSYSSTAGLIPAAELDLSGLSWQRAAEPTFLVKLDKPFDDYFQSDLSAKFRKNVKMYRKRLQKAGESKVRHLIGKQALEAWPEFVRIEGSGWKGQEGSSINALPANYQHYYRGLARLLAERDALHLYFLSLEDQPVAAAFCYREGEVLHYAKIGYLEEYGSLSPSNLLLLDIIEDVRESCPEVRTVNLFPWSGGYKHRFANDEASCIDTVVYTRTGRGRLVRLMHGLKAALRRTPGLLWTVNALRRLTGRSR